MMTMSSLLCIVCNLKVDISSSVNIFYTYLPHSQELLANYVSRVLHKTVSDLNGSNICTQCNNLFEMLEQAQRTVSNIRCEILKVYHVSGKRRYNKTISNEDSVLNISTDINTDENYIRQVEHNENVQNNPTQQLPKLNAIEEKTPIQSVNILSGDFIANNKGVEHARDVFVEGSHDTNKLHSTRTSEYNVISAGTKDAIVLKENILLDSSGLTNDNNSNGINTLHKKEIYNFQRCKVYKKCHRTAKENKKNVVKLSNSEQYQCQKCKEVFTDISIANVHVLNLHTGDKDCITVASKPNKNEVLDIVKAETNLSEDELEMTKTIQSGDHAWNEIEHCVSQAKENSSKTGGSKCEEQSIFTSRKISKHSLKPLKYPCPTCGKKWRTNRELSDHLKAHSSLRPYMCEKCGQGYKHKHALEVHVGMHNGINPFQCNICKKSFTQKISLMRHLPIHTGETPYQCELCGKRFVHHTSYNIHRLSHTGRKLYKCDICDLSLLSTSHLKRHLRVHTGEKPHSCNICGKRFAQRYNLLAHEKIHDPLLIKSKNSDTLHKCCHCDQIFPKKIDLLNHIKNEHPDNSKKEVEAQKSCDVISAESETNVLSKGIDLENNGFGQTWIQMSRNKLDVINDESKLMLLQNSLSSIDGNSFAVTFNDHKLSLENPNYNTSLQVIIGSSNAPGLSNNHLAINKTQM